MTQYPPNYQPPQYGYPYQQPPDPLAAAKRASIVMFILGGLCLCCGICSGIFAVIPWDQMAASDANMAKLQRQVEDMGISPGVLFGIMAVITLLPGLLYVIFGFFVRRGSMAVTIMSIVLTALVILLSLVSILGSFIHVGSSPAGPQGNPCLGVVGLLLAGVLLVLLIQAVKGISRNSTTAAQYQQQYWQYQQQQYHQPFPPQPPPPMPPPPTFDAPPKDPNTPA